MATFTNNFAALLAPGLRKIYGDSYMDYPEEYSIVFDIDTIKDRNYIEDHSITTLGLVTVKAHGKSIDYDEAYDGYTKRYTFVTYGLGFMVTREMFEDDLYRKMSQMPKALARSVRQTIEITAANVLNRAFNSSYTGADGKEMCATDHPLIGGGTFQNELTTAADLDVTSYEQALIDIQAFVDDRGLKVATRPTKLIIHPSNEFQANMILKSSQLPDTANNNYNPAQGTMSGGVAKLHWLTDSDAWFIKTDVPDGLTFLWRRRPEFAQDSDFDSENAKFKTTMRFDCGWTDPRGIYGSPGA